MLTRSGVSHVVLQIHGRRPRECLVWQHVLLCIRDRTLANGGAVPLHRLCLPVEQSQHRVHRLRNTMYNDRVRSDTSVLSGRSP